MKLLRHTTFTTDFPSQSENPYSNIKALQFPFQEPTLNSKTEETHKDLLKAEMKFHALQGILKNTFKTLEDISNSKDINEIKSQIYHLKKNINLQINTEHRWESFQNHFDLVQSDFYKKLKAQYTCLTLVDLELCAYLRMEMTTKDIANQLNLSIRGVETRKYRLKKKLSLKKTEDLNTFINSI